MCNANHILYIYFNMQSRSEALHVTAKNPEPCDSGLIANRR